MGKKSGSLEQAIPIGEDSVREVIKGVNDDISDVIIEEGNLGKAAEEDDDEDGDEDEDEEDDADERFKVCGNF